MARAAPADEATVVARGKRGDADALQWIARTEEARVRRLLMRMLGPRHDIDDLVQNVFLELCRALPGFRGDSKLSTFVGGITVRVARRAMRPGPWWRRRSDADVEGQAVGEDARHSGPEDRTVAAERLRRVRIALGKIGDKKRIAFILWALEGMDPGEIAATMGASVSATRSRIFYAQKELRRLAHTDPYLRELVHGSES